MMDCRCSYWYTITLTYSEWEIVLIIDWGIKYLTPLTIVNVLEILDFRNLSSFSLTKTRFASLTVCLWHSRPTKLLFLSTNIVPLLIIPFDYNYPGIKVELHLHQLNNCLVNSLKTVKTNCCLNLFIILRHFIQNLSSNSSLSSKFMTWDLRHVPCKTWLRLL